MTALRDFGHAGMGTGSWLAVGERPLLTILVHMPASPYPSLAHDTNFYSELIFGTQFASGPNGPVYRRNVRDYYAENSCGRFKWKPTSPAIVGPITLSDADANLPLQTRRKRIVQIVKDTRLFDFSPYDLSGDRAISGNELGVLIIDDSSNDSGQTGDVPALSDGGAPGASPLQVSGTGQRPSLTLIAHELSHQLGTIDLYGYDESRNDRCTLMGPHEYDDGTTGWHLDAWHKMRLGWYEPAIYELAPRTGLSLVAPGAQDPKGAAILYSPAKGYNEYFIVEFRNPKQARGRYDDGVASRGIAIWHVVTTAFDPVKIPAGGADYRGVWTEGAPDPTKGVEPLPGQSDRDFQRTGNRFWDRRTLTPPLRWSDGTSTGIRLSVRDFADNADRAVVDLVAENIPRQARSGWLIRGDYGTAGNYEMIVPQGMRLVHYWRNNDDPNHAWHRAEVFDFGPQLRGDARTLGETPLGAALLQNAIKANGVNGNLAVTARMHPNGVGKDYLAFFELNNATRKWSSAQPIVADGVKIEGVTGDPALIQSNYGSIGNFEMIVPQGTRLVHYWRNNDDPNNAWHQGTTFNFGPQLRDRVGSLGTTPLGVALLQSTIKGDGVHGNFDVVARMHPNAGGKDYLAFFALDSATGKWTSAQPIVADGVKIEGVTGDPALIQSDYGGVGNYEMMVPQGTRLVHYWRNNDDPNYAWHQGSVFEFGPQIRERVGSRGSTPLGVALMQSAVKGNGTNGNFDVLAWMRPNPSGKSYLAFFGFDTATRKWSSAQPILADGQRIELA